MTVREVGAPEGTLVEVADLFFNLPARRKFLKADTAESAQVSRLVTQLALGYPRRGLRVAERRAAADRSAACRVARASASIRSTATAPTSCRPEGGRGHHGARLCRGARRAGAGARTAARVRQSADRPRPDDRARDPAGVQRRDDQGAQPRSASVHRICRPIAWTSTCIRPRPKCGFSIRGSCTRSSGAPSMDALGDDGSAGAGARAGVEPAVPVRRRPAAAARVRARASPGTAGTAPRASSWAGRLRRRAPTGRRPHLTTAPGSAAVAELLRPMVPLGQFRNTFIIAADEEGLAIIDQHVAHERILFEQIAERLTARTLESQRLLTPVVLELGPGEHQTLLQHRSALAAFGFEVDDFGGTSLAVDGRARAARMEPQRGGASRAWRATSTASRRRRRERRASPAWRRRWRVTPPSRRTTRSRARRCSTCSTSCGGPRTRRSARTADRSCSG